MRFFKGFVGNIMLLIIIGIALFIIAPGMMRQIFQLFNGLFGPLLIILIIIVAALPRKRSRN